MRPHTHVRRLLLALPLLLSLAAASAQNISVKSFRLLETDLTANLEGTKETDQNGEVAALIKVITTETGFVFDVGMLGIVRTIQQVGEIWVYVPRGVQRISINHQRLGRLAEPYYFPVPIESARTYELELTTSRVRTVVEEDAGGGYLALKVTPSSAIVFIDDKAQALSADGTLSLFLLYGQHTYRVEAPGYRSESGTVTIASEETQTVTVTLPSTLAKVVLTTEMVDAEIWVNNERKGMGSWKGELPAGAYIIETRREGFRSQRTTVTLAEEEERTLTLQSPEPVFGRLRAESNPLEAEVWLDEKKLGTTPGIFNDIPAGTHTFRFIKDGYEPTSVEVTVEEGKIATASATLVSTGKDVEGDLQPVTTETVTPAKPKTPEEPKPQEPKPKKESQPSLFAPLAFYGSADLQIGCPFAAGASLGGYLGGFNMEVSFGVPFGEMARGYHFDWTIVGEDGFAESTFEQYYDQNLFVYGHIGYGIPITRYLRLTPRVGVSMFSLVTEKSAYDQTTYILSGVASMRAEVAFSSKMGMYITPQYNLPVKRGTIAGTLCAALSDFNLLNNGFYLSVGLWINLFSAK